MGFRGAFARAVLGRYRRGTMGGAIPSWWAPRWSIGIRSAGYGRQCQGTRGGSLWAVSCGAGIESSWPGPRLPRWSPCTSRYCFTRGKSRLHISKCANKYDWIPGCPRGLSTGGQHSITSAGAPEQLRGDTAHAEPEAATTRQAAQGPGWNTCFARSAITCERESKGRGAARGRIRSLPPLRSGRHGARRR